MSRRRYGVGIRHVKPLIQARMRGRCETWSHDGLGGIMLHRIKNFAQFRDGAPSIDPGLLTLPYDSLIIGKGTN